MSIDIRTTALSGVTTLLASRAAAAWLAALAALATFMMAAPSALAAPDDPPPPPPTAQDSTTQAVSGDTSAPPTGVPHLPSPDNLPPGTTDAPPPQGRGMSYLRDLWHAMQTQNVSGSDALLLLTQRPLDPKATPPPGLPAGPQQPGPQQPQPAELAPAP